MMKDDRSQRNIHPMGERKIVRNSNKKVACETLGGRIHIKWGAESPMTPYAQVGFFADFLKTSGVYEKWIQEAPLYLTSNNAPRKEDIFGTAVISVLTGQRRYAHITGIRGDAILEKYFNMEKIVSEDSLRNNLKKMDEEASCIWMLKHMQESYLPLLQEPYIMDIDVTIKPLYGKQEGACVGYNPHKPGRPSHTYHTYFIANLRLVLHVDVQDGKKTSGKYTQPMFWTFYDSLLDPQRPQFIRGDISYGTDSMMSECEARDQAYLFKLRKTPHVKKLISMCACSQDESWQPAGNGWEGIDKTLKLQGWKKERRVVVLRRKLKTSKKNQGEQESTQLLLGMGNGISKMDKYEYAVLITSLSDPLYTVSCHYYDRADAENNFDELKNQWGWGGFTTRDLKRCRIMARIIALTYNWWSIYMRLAVPNKHIEAVRSRPLFLHGVGRMISHSRQTLLKITSHHAQASYVERILNKIRSFMQWIRSNAEQLKNYGAYRMILSVAFNVFLGEYPLKIPKQLIYE